MADNILLECARKFDEISDYNYLFTVGKKQKTIINISLACARKDFTHTVGLDHLSDIKELSSKRASIKLSVFENILNNKLTYDKISSSEFFRLAFPDCLDLSQRQEHPFTILLEEKVNVKTNETTVLFEHHNYKQKSAL